MGESPAPQGVFVHLKNTCFAVSGIELLSGGQSTFTYRVVLKILLNTGEKTIVIKHYEGFIARMKNMKLGVERADHGYKALSATAHVGLFSLDSTVRLPQPISCDQEMHTIFIYDLGSPIPLA
ncbi:hypothetical protein B0J17DRAFT_633504 [Rhizoctonia solani]|nr:hypothetical protein B0J17DRAFT_633504 [Rhizoctonia solani]